MFTFYKLQIVVNKMDVYFLLVSDDGYKCKVSSEVYWLVEYLNK
jgi:hypothetical protein